jgi:hypothetical protein
MFGDHSSRILAAFIIIAIARCGSWCRRARRAGGRVDPLPFFAYSLSLSQITQRLGRFAPMRGGLGAGAAPRAQKQAWALSQKTEEDCTAQIAGWRASVSRVQGQGRNLETPLHMHHQDQDHQAKTHHTPMLTMRASPGVTGGGYAGR